MKTIDLNCDLGEGGLYDAQLMQYISSCNIACGGHIGNEKSIISAVESAIKNKVNIGAHPSYPDREGFGRRSIEIPLGQLSHSIKTQIRRVKQIAEDCGGYVRHIKPHGALYNDLVTDREKSEVLVNIIEEIDAKLILFVPPFSELERAAKGRLKTWTEGFMDRGYDREGKLVSRGEPGALLTERNAVLHRMMNIVTKKRIQTIENEFFTVNFRTVCVHSDTEGALALLRDVVRTLKENGIKIG